AVRRHLVDHVREALETEERQDF
ncbi:MAG: hypothetical protein RL245_1500, partial [Pseudomonadota bacterium]